MSRVLHNYYSNIVTLITGDSKTNEIDMSNTRVLEFRAGTGFLSELMQEKFQISVECLEIDESLLKILQGKGFKTYSNLSSLSERYDLIFSSNVLEHIENDVEVLIALKKNLAPSGNLVTYVPAFPILFSDLDRAVGHYRRYTRKELKKKLTRAGYIAGKIHYVNSLGFPASLLLRLLGYKTKGNIGGLSSLKLYDRLILPFSRFLDDLGLKYIIGKNIIVHARLGH